MKRLHIICASICLIIVGSFQIPYNVSAIVVSDTLEPSYYGEWNPGFNALPEDFVIADDGYIYQVGTSDDPRNGLSTFHLLKWSPTATLVWNKTWDRSVRTSVYGIACYDSFIYTVGRISTTSGYESLLVKWSSNGDILWVKSWNLTSRTRSLDVVVDQNGNVFVLSAVFDYNETATQLNLGVTFLLKYDHEGVLLSSSPGDYCFGRDMTLKISDEGFLYSLDPYYGSLTKWDSAGSIQWILGGAYTIFDVSSDGHLIIGTHFPPYTIRKISSDQNEIWNVTDRVIWEEYYGGLDICGAIDVSPNDTTYLLYKARGEDNNLYVLDKFDALGTLVWNKTIEAPETWNQDWADVFTWASGIESSNQGVLYISATTLNEELPLGMGKVAYGTPSILSGDMMILIIAASIIIVAIIIVVILKKRQ